jgi:hypothetical protein
MVPYLMANAIAATFIHIFYVLRIYTSGVGFTIFKYFGQKMEKKLAISAQNTAILYKNMYVIIKLVFKIIAFCLKFSKHRQKW